VKTAGDQFGSRGETPEREPSLWCCDFELTGTGAFWGPVAADGQESARVLVRLHGHPMGYLTVPMTGPRSRAVGAPHWIGNRSFPPGSGCEVRRI